MIEIAFSAFFALLSWTGAYVTYRYLRRHEKLTDEWKDIVNERPEATE